eukprot:1161075-Pelagomonas_calceolata.AAC.18
MHVEEGGWGPWVGPKTWQVTESSLAWSSGVSEGALVLWGWICWEEVADQEGAARAAMEWKNGWETGRGDNTPEAWLLGDKGCEAAWSGPGTPLGMPDGNGPA